jgi:hypothetical protein
VSGGASAEVSQVRRKYKNAPNLGHPFSCLIENTKVKNSEDRVLVSFSFYDETVKRVWHDAIALVRLLSAGLEARTTAGLETGATFLQ